MKHFHPYICEYSDKYTRGVIQYDLWYRVKKHKSIKLGLEFRHIRVSRSNFRIRFLKSTVTISIMRNKNSNRMVLSYWTKSDRATQKTHFNMIQSIFLRMHVRIFKQNKSLTLKFNKLQWIYRWINDFSSVSMIRPSPSIVTPVSAEAL